MSQRIVTLERLRRIRQQLADGLQRDGLPEPFQQRLTVVQQELDGIEGDLRELGREDAQTLFGVLCTNAMTRLSHVLTHPNAKKKFSGEESDELHRVHGILSRNQR